MTTFFASGWAKKPIESCDEPENMPLMGRFWRPVKWILNLLVFGGLLYWSTSLFTIRPKLKPFRIESKIAFSNDDLDRFLRITVPLSIAIGVLSLFWEIIKSLVKSLFVEAGALRKLTNLVGCALLGVAALGMFSVSLVSHTRSEPLLAKRLPTWVNDLHLATVPYKVTKDYGLFRRMTGVGGRPEVIIEGSNNMDRGWKEYNFLYKPGNVTQKLPIVAPHQPRLDWQMWFAALGSYQQHPWFLNMVYRLFHNQKEVLDLMGENPFPDTPPKYIRAVLYHYHYTSNDKKSERYTSSNEWWVRKRVREYLPIITKDEPSFINYLKQAGIIENPHPKNPSNVKPNFLSFTIHGIRSVLGQTNGFRTTLSLFFTGLLLTFLDPTVDVFSWPEVR